MRASGERAATAALLVLVSALLSGPKPGVVHRVDAGEAEVLRPFELVNWDGRTVTRDSLKGRTTILVFTFAKCVFGCPMITHQLKEMDEELGRPGNLVYLHVTVNPELDTPEEMRKHFAKHGIDPAKDRRWLFLTGTQADIDSTLEAYGIGVRRTLIEGEVLTEHTTRVLVVDPEGRITAAFDTYQWSEEEMAHALKLQQKS